LQRSCELSAFPLSFGRIATEIVRAALAKRTKNGYTRTMIKTYKIGGMHCAACAASVERVTKKLPFTDSAQVADWALAPLAFCFDNGILDASAAEIRPATPIRRGEIAQMLYNLLDSAALL